MNKTSKSEVYSWRLSTELKARLEEAARAEKTTVGGLLERVAQGWLQQRALRQTDEKEQARLREDLFAAIAQIEASDRGPPDPYSKEKLRRRIVERLSKKHGLRQPR